jgi:hypothetical protein
VYGAISLDKAKFTFRFASVFDGQTFFEFLRQLVPRYDGRKVFLIIDNAPCHRLDDEASRGSTSIGTSSNCIACQPTRRSSWRWRASGRRSAS